MYSSNGGLKKSDLEEISDFNSAFVVDSSLYGEDPPASPVTKSVVCFFLSVFYLIYPKIIEESYKHIGMASHNIKTMQFVVNSFVNGAQSVPMIKTNVSYRDLRNNGIDKPILANNNNL